MIGFIPGQVGDEACIEIDGNFITGLNLFAGFLAFQNGEADVDGIPVEDPGKGLGDDTGDPRLFDGDGGVLPRGAAAEVESSDRKSVV